MLGSGIDEVYETCTAIEFGKEESSIGLEIRIFDPLKARFDDAVLAACLAKNPTTIAACSHGPILHTKSDER